MRPRALQLVLLLLLALGPAHPQKPLAWWRFEEGGPHLGTDSSTNGSMPLNLGHADSAGRPPVSQGAVGGCVGRYLRVVGANVSEALAATTAAPLPRGAGPGITVELLFRLPSNGSFNKAGNTTILRAGSGLGDAGWALAFDRHSIGFRAAGRVVAASMIGSGVRSMFNLADDEWHHLACRLDGATGEQSIWIDGQCPDENPLALTRGSRPANASAAPGKLPAASGVVTLLASAFDGDLDEVAVYGAALSNGTIWAHFQSATQLHSPYPFVAVAAPAPPPLPAEGALNTSDFPPGTSLPTPDGCSSLCCCTSLVPPGVLPVDGEPAKCFTSSCKRLNGSLAQKLIPPIDQLRAFPSPRFLTNPATGPRIGVPQRNFNWMGVSNMAGSEFDYYGLNQSAAEVSLQKELAGTFHYNVMLDMMHVTTQGYEGSVCDMFGFEPTHAQYCLVRDGLYQLLREHPDWGVDTVFQRQGTPHCAKYGRRINATAVIGPHGCEKDWRYLNQSLPDGCYLKDAQGRYLTLTGALATNHSQPPKVLRPTTAAGAETNSCPDTIFSAEWRAFRTHGHYKAAGLPRPIDRINNDGEYNVGYMNAATTIDPATGTCAFDRDPQVVADYKNSGIPALANGRPDWYSFVSRWRARFSTQFSDAITNDPLSPEYRNASFTEYQVEGTDLFYGEWNETRQINTPVWNGGKLRHYSTGDFYPWFDRAKSVLVGPGHNISVYEEFGTPSWDASHGAWQGLDWIMSILPSQIATGDTVWSPFVAAGWSEREDLNTRPAQWLAFLKLLTITGAEYFYGCFFSLHQPWPDPRNWIWQSAAPALAQAVNSHWLDVLYNGELLRGDMPVPPLACAIGKPMSEPFEWEQATDADCQMYGNLPGTAKAEPTSATATPYQSFRFWAGSQSVAVLVRRLGDVFVISGAVLPQSNVNEAPLSQDVEITLPNATGSTAGTVVRFTVRRQGSTYILNRTLGRPTMRQLDSWHEATHFLRWSSNFVLEAELHDDHAQRSTASIHTELAASALHRHDFVGSCTHVSLRHGEVLRFTVSPRPVRVDATGAVAGPLTHRRYAVRVRARRVRDAPTVPTISVSAQDGNVLGSASVTALTFAWSRVLTLQGEGSVSEATVMLPTSGPSTLTIVADGALDVDSVELVEQA